MAFCPNCGDPLEQGSKKCSNCGYEIAESVYQEQPAKKQVSSSGIISLAWSDIKQSEGWIGKSLLLALLLLIPIVDFFVLGYIARWGRLAAFRQGDSFIGDIFTTDNFTWGFFAFVIALIGGIVIGIAGCIPIVGWAALILMMPFLYLCITRMLVIGNFKDAFEIKDVWDKYKNGFAGTMAVCWIPELILTLFGVVAGIILTLIGGASLVGLIMGDAAGLVGIGVLLIVGAVLMFVLAVASVVTNAIMFRSLGYWTSRIAPDWVQKSLSAK